MNFEAIQQQYKVPAAKGMRIDVRGKMATITGFHGYRLLARFDDSDAITQIHPVLGVTYPKAGELYPKSSRGPRPQHLSLVAEPPLEWPPPRVASLPEDDPRHGLPNTYKAPLNCRCEKCTEAWRVKCAELKAKRLAMTLDPEDARHGTTNFWANYGCRCEKCTVTWNAAREEARLKRIAERKAWENSAEYRAAQAAPAREMAS